MKQAVLPLMPAPFGQLLQDQEWNCAEELRMRVGQPLVMGRSDREVFVGPPVTTEHLEEVLRRACHQSVYACTETLKEGFVTIEGGHRIGVCGTGVLKDGSVQSLRQISSLSVRLARQIRGCAEGLLSELRGSALLVGPPGSGKTTLLRDCVRLLSDEGRQRVGLVDERGELAASVCGVPQMYVGSRTDILVNVQKAEGIMMLLRTMNPQWIAVDEITAPADVHALEIASYCGVHMLATAHGSSEEDLYKRPLYRQLMETGIFRCIVLLDRKKRWHIVEVSA